MSDELNIMIKVGEQKEKLITLLEIEKYIISQKLMVQENIGKLEESLNATTKEATEDE